MTTCNIIHNYVTHNYVMLIFNRDLADLMLRQNQDYIDSDPDVLQLGSRTLQRRYVDKSRCCE